MDAPNSGNLPERECSVCHGLFPADDLAAFGQRLVCIQCKPRYVQALKEGALLAEDFVWRKGQLIILRVGSQLPQRCLRCNAAAPHHGRRIRQTWFSLFRLPTRIDISLPVCEHHHRRFRQAQWIGGVLAVLGVAAIFVSGTGAWLGLLLIVAGAIASSLYSTSVSISRVDREHIELVGAKRPFLDSLPTWPE